MLIVIPKDLTMVTGVQLIVGETWRFCSSWKSPGEIFSMSYTSITSILGGNAIFLPPDTTYNLRTTMSKRPGLQLNNICSGSDMLF